MITGSGKMTHRCDPLRLRAMTWNHSRGYNPMVATAQRKPPKHAQPAKPERKQRSKDLESEQAINH